MKTEDPSLAPFASLVPSWRRAQGTGHRAQGAEHRAWSMGKFCLQSGRQGERGQGKRLSEKSIKKYENEDPSLVPSCHREKGTGHRAWSMEHGAGFAWGNSVFKVADKWTRGNGDKERQSHFSPCLPVSLSPCLLAKSWQDSLL